MPKQVLQITDFSAGLNCFSDARDIKDNEFAQNWNAVVDKAGVIRVSGMAEDSILTDFHNNSNFQAGYGLFQFSADYSLNEISSDFNYGIKSGTLSDGDASSATLETTASSQVSNYYKYMHFFVYDGVGVGESADITASSTASPPVLTTATGIDLDNTSKYYIYPWYYQGYGEAGGTDGSDTNGLGLDAVTDGIHTSMESSNLNNSSGNYYFFSKRTAQDEDSANLGYMRYNWDGTDSKLTLKPGVEYNLSFRCAGAQRFYNLVSDGTWNADLAGTADTPCDRPPGIALHNSSVEDNSGCIRTMSSATGDISASAAWQDAQTHYDIVPTSSDSVNGTGGAFDIVTSNSGATLTFYTTNDRGTNYLVGDVLTFTDPGSTTNTCTMTVALVNRVGCRLYSDGKFVTNQEFPADTKGVAFCTNLIDNGDFQDGVPPDNAALGSNQWVESDSNGHIVCAELAADGHGGHDGTCQITASGLSFSGGIPNSHIYNQAYLGNNARWHLNFQYDSSDGIYFMIKDKSTGRDEFIQGWTKLPPTRKAGDAANYRFAGAEYNSRYSSGIGNVDMNYITFDVKNKRASSAVNVANNTARSTIKIAFAPASPNGVVNLTGVTVTPGTNDLVTMSHKSKSGANPFSDDFKLWSEYRCRFKIPENWGESSDYLLEFNFGEFGYRASNTLGATAEQTIYVDDIRLVSEKDTITLLTDNTSSKSVIHAYSASSQSWISDYVTWPGVNSKPNFDYINGMLKISDGNFENNNSNKFIYYSGKSNIESKAIEGWKYRNSAISEAPSVVIKEVTGDIDSSQTFDGIDFLNLYFKGQHYGITPDNPAGTGQWGANWNLDEFGRENIYRDSTDRHLQGIIVRLLRDKDNYHTTNDGAPGHSYAPIERTQEDLWWPHFYNRESEWYIDNIKTGHDPDGETNSTSQDATTASLPADYCKNGGWEANAGFIKNSNDTETSNYKPHNPVQIIIKGEDFKNYIVTNDENPEGVTYSNIGMSQQMGSNEGDVYKIKMQFDYHSHWRSTHAAQDIAGSSRVPYFKITAGKVDASGEQDDNGDAFYKACVGDDVGFDGGVVLAEKNIGVNGFETITYQNIWDDTYDHNDYDTNGLIESSEIGQGQEYAGNVSQGHPFYMIVKTAEFELQFSRNEIKKTDDILIKLQIFYNDAAGVYQDGTEIFTVAMPNTQLNSNEDISPPDSFYYQYQYSENFFINNLNISFYNTLLQESDVSIDIGSGRQAQTNFSFAEPEQETATGWGERTFKLATTSVNIFGEESALNMSEQSIGGYVQLGDAPSIRVSMGDGQYNDEFIKKTKFYMKDNEADIWYLQFYIDHENGKFFSSTSSISSLGSYDSSIGVTTWDLNRENFLNFNEVNSYESETMVSQDSATSNAKLTCRYKTSVVANSRLYVGNIYQGGRQYGDRMIKSPIGKYNILPSSNFIDVATNDGDEITALAYYKDKILQFKKRKVFVINTSGDYEFLEDTLENVGITGDCSVTTTPHGIAWANKSGCYLYNGEQMVNLIDKIIPTESGYTTISNNYWLASAYSNNNPAIGYIDSRDSLLIKWTSDDKIETIPSGVTYSFGTKSWTFLQRVFSGKSDEADTGDISNMITSVDGDILFYRVKSDDAFSGIKKWTNTPLNNYSSNNNKTFYFTTKDFTFGNISVRKKISKVYVTYKVDTDGTDSGIGVYAQINGTEFDGTLSNNIRFSQTSKFAGTTTNCYASETLDETDAKWKIAELKFATPSEVNNIYSMQLLFISTGVAADFEINDISIVYRAKNIK